MKPHHQAAINRLIRCLRVDPTILAIIITGSVARGTARDDSDIDIYLVVTDQEFERRKAENLLYYFNAEICDYSGGYIDGRIIDYHFLEHAVKKGSEPIRASFVGAYAAYSKIHNLDALIRQIPVFQESKREEHLATFYAQIQVYRYLALNALEKNNAYLLSHALSQLVLYSGRLILTYNRVLFPGHTFFMGTIAQVKDKPPSFIPLANELLLQPTKEKIFHFVEIIDHFKDWGRFYSEAVDLFVKNNEWHWLNSMTETS